MHKNLRKAFDKEIAIAKDFYSRAQYDESFHHLERAHVLGQCYVIPHTKTHVWMLCVGIRTGNLKEIAGQLIRIPGGIVASTLGKVPIGNTGGTNIKLTATLPIPDDLKIHFDHNEQE